MSTFDIFSNSDIYLKLKLIDIRRKRTYNTLRRQLIRYVIFHLPMLYLPVKNKVT